MEIKVHMGKYKKFDLKKFPVFSQGCLGFPLASNKRKSKVKQKISMEAKNPRVLEKK